LVVGVVWVARTGAFEFLAGHYALASWERFNSFDHLITLSASASTSVGIMTPISFAV
jgi:hypothetical protein